MPNTLPITIVMGALPPRVRWRIQALADAMVARMSLQTSASFALFAAGSTEPSSNVGPWFNGTSWLYWSNVTGDYQPIILAPESLGYTIGANPPNPLIYSLWLETTVGGSPLALKIYFGGAWVDVYAAVLVPYLTIAAFNTAIASYSTTAAMNAAIASAVTGITSYPAQGTNAAPQSIPVDVTPHQVLITTSPINPAPAPISTVSSRYIAPASGIYAVACTSQFDNNTGAAAGMEVVLTLYKNGVDAGYEDVDSTPSPNGDRWSPGFTVIISLATNDHLEIWATLQDGVNVGAVDLTTFDFSVWRISG